MIYDRKLNDGSGESVYGLEVCKSLDLPDEFLITHIKLEINMTIKKCLFLNYLVHILILEKWLDYCELCKNKPADEVQYLAYQCNANENGYIDEEMHKNNLANLCNICNDCHRMLHGEDKEFIQKKNK